MSLFLILKFYFIPCSTVSIVDFEQVKAYWDVNITNIVNIKVLFEFSSKCLIPLTHTWFMKY